jgi:hypothetical protein
MQIDLWNYTNPTGNLYNGQCCDTYLFSSNCTGLSNGCNVRLKICIDTIDNINNTKDFESCYHYSTVINGIGNKNTFSFKDNPQAVNPLVIRNLNWNINDKLPRFIMKFFAIDDGTTALLPEKRIAEKLIDLYVIDFNQNQNIIPSSGFTKPSEINWIPFPMVSGEYRTSTFKTFMSLAIAMKCSTNYYTTSCNVRCVQQDSCAAGHYECDGETGSKICKYGFIGPTTDCVTKDASIQLCPLPDSELCSSNGICYMNYVTSLNQSYPTCCCNKGFGGPKCSQIISCDVNPCRNDGFCSFDVKTGRGSCICKLGFKGSSFFV